jgi:hypothetical protein
MSVSFKKGTFMSIMDLGAWSLIIGLSLVSVGGLLIWAYGSTLRSHISGAKGAVAARRSFVGVLIYSVIMIVVGGVVMLQGSFSLLT